MLRELKVLRVVLCLLFAALFWGGHLQGQDNATAKSAAAHDGSVQATNSDDPDGISSGDRAKQLIQEREYKREHFEEPAKPKNLSWFGSLFESQGNPYHFGSGEAVTGFGLEFGNIATNSGLSAGLRYHQTSFQGDAAYSRSGYQQYSIQAGYNPPYQNVIFEPYHWGDIYSTATTERKGVFSFLDIRYRDLLDENFFGLDGNTFKSSRTDYELKEFYAGGTFGYQWGKHYLVDVRGGYLAPIVDAGGNSSLPDTFKRFDNITAPGLTDRRNFWRVGSSFLMDYRDKPGNPHKGVAFGVSVSHYDDLNSNLYEFNRFTLDTRAYVPLWSPIRIFATRLLTSFTQVPSGMRVPFYYMDTLGGADTLEGYEDFRFRDRNLVVWQNEYRWEPAPFLEFALIYHIGKTFSRVQNFDLNELKKGYGFGVRFKTPEFGIFRVDITRGDEGNTIYVRAGSSF